MAQSPVEVMRDEALRRIESRMIKGHAVVVLSGGMDSATVLALAVAKHHPENVTGVSFDYGQRHTVELECAADLCSFYEVPRHIVAGVQLGQGGVLMDHKAEMPHMTYEELAEAQGPSPTYVPYRNGTFLSLAASLALDERIKAGFIYAGMHSEDAANWAYPDCTPEFIGAMQNAIYVGSYHKVRLVVPFTYKTKAEIVKLGHELGVPFEKTHSCYEGKRPACGKCPTCVGRLEAFRANDLEDPLKYEFDKYRSSH
jgi:7-cyano-7-deazaguanine synthase